MKLFIVGFTLVAVACAAYAPSSEYLPPVQEVSQSVEIAGPSNDYLAPAVTEEENVFADDGYRYKTVRRLRHRHRRDVSELNQYLPPTQEAAPEAVEIIAPSNEYLAPAVAEEQTILADDGYRYKTVRRLRHRNKRDVSELNLYLPPTQEAASEAVEIIAPSNEYLAPAVAEEQTVLADDGYRYKTVRRLRHRNKRDVSELNQYLPPTQEAAQEAVEIIAPSNEYLAPAVAEEQTVLADDGYRYKTVRRLRHRNKRDVSELNQYLPPTQEAAQEAVEIIAPSNEYLAPAVAEEQTILADDGYRYKTVRRLRHRNKRDVSELNLYLPPTQEATQEAVEIVAPSNEYLAPAGAEEQTVLADDGYRYKTVRRLRHRNKRDVSELNQYLPPTQEAAQEAVEIIAPTNEYLPPAVAEEQTVLADDGYRYKTVRRLRHRNKRDVSELNLYLPPTQEAAQEAVEIVAPSNEYLAPAIAEEQTVLADDGYRYKTVRRLRHRNKRDVSELNLYLPPTQEAAQEAVEIIAPSNEYLAPAVAEEQTILADDGYRYKTVRRLRHRNKRDVSELNQYLPPTQEAAQEAVEIIAPSNEYLAPAVAEEQTVLADDGYRYKTVRRLRHRNKRDVSELNQYLPPTQEAAQEAVEIIAPSNEYLAPAVAEEQTVLADDGYRYKTVRRLRHRHRRDVSELNQYLPPNQESTIEISAPSNEYLAPALDQQETDLGIDGYRYKSVRKLKVRRH